MADRNSSSRDGQQSHGGSSSSSSGVSELHSCLIPFILVKLPIKSIIICKCVCKAWNQLILDPYFTNLYSKNSPFAAMVFFQRPKYISNHLRDRDFRFLEIGSNGDVITTPFNSDRTLKITKGERCQTRLVGSFNGFLCVVVTPFLILKSTPHYHHYRFKPDSIFVINPLTGESVKIPHVKGAKNSCREIYGFGSSLDGEYYKVVKIFEFFDANGECRLDLKIITVGVDDEWRDFNDPAILNVFVSDGLALNGIIHWVDHKSNVNSIYAFDVGKEIGHRIPGPSSSVLGGYLGVCDDHLCFTQDNENELQFDVWTMRQYGVPESWTKDIILRKSNLSPNIYPATIPKTTRRNGDLLLSVVSYEGHKSLISFDPKTKNYIKLEEVYDEDKDTDSDLLEYNPCFSSLCGMISRQITNRDSRASGNSIF